MKGAFSLNNLLVGTVRPPEQRGRNTRGFGSECLKGLWLFLGKIPGKSVAKIDKSRRESSGGMEWLGVWNCIFSASEISNFGP